MRSHIPKPRLTTRELNPIIAFYHTQLPSWKIIQKDILAREDGPIAQGIAFERLSGGEYRPIGHIHVLVAPAEHWYLEMPQDLNIKVRQINRRQHPEFRDRVIEAIRAEFVPHVDAPLIAEEVLSLYERELNPPRSLDAYSLAAFSAFLGQNDRAIYWCLRFTELVNASGATWLDCDYKRREFLDRLESWIKAGTAKVELQKVLLDERHKWGLA